MKHFSFLNRHGQGIDSPGNATPVTYDTQSAYGKSAKTHQRNKAYANPRCIDESSPLQTQLVQKRTRADWIALALLLITSSFIFLWNLDASGYANGFYSAAAQAGAQNWEAFLWGSLDAGNAITVDKPPAAIWLMALSVRILGLSSFAILLPQALMGIGCTYLCYAITRRYWGNWAGITAGLLFAFTPVAALMFRFNNPDALLVLLMLGASGCLMRGLEFDTERTGSKKRSLWFAAAGILVGLGFLTKQLQVFLVLPGFALAMFACSPAPIRRRFLDAVIALGCMIVSAGWWVLLTVIVPSGERPYIGGSQTDSFLELTFSYNGLGRLTGNETGSVVPGSTGGSAQGGMWGETGIFRLFSSGFNDQITWLALLAFAGIVIGIIAALALKKRHRESRATVTAMPFHMPHSTFGSNLDYAFSLENAIEVCRMRLAFIAVFGSWLVVTWLVFSFMAGIFHQYYTVALAPAVAVLTAVCLQSLWEQRRHAAAKATFAILITISAVWAFALVRQSGWQTWLAYAIVIAGTGSAALGLICALLGHGESGNAKLARASRKGMRFTVAVALVALMTAPIAWTGCTIAEGHHGSIVTAGPGNAQGMGGGAPSDNANSQTDANDQPNEADTAQSSENGDVSGNQEDVASSTGSPTTAGSGQPSDMSQPAQNGPGNNGGGPGGNGGGNLLGDNSSNEELTALLKENASGYRWAAATTGSQNAAGYQLSSELPVMAIGGFNGSDPAPTLDEFKSFVEEGLVRYYISSEGMGGGQMGGSNAAEEIAEWVSANFEALTIDGVTVYDLSSASTS